jgi:hypothetical protein
MPARHVWPHLRMSRDRAVVNDVVVAPYRPDSCAPWTADGPIMSRHRNRSVPGSGTWAKLGAKHCCSSVDVAGSLLHSAALLDTFRYVGQLSIERSPKCRPNEAEAASPVGHPCEPCGTTRWEPSGLPGLLIDMPNKTEERHMAVASARLPGCFLVKWWTATCCSAV